LQQNNAFYFMLTSKQVATFLLVLLI